MKFKHYIGIDYSGAATPATRSATIQVYAGSGHADPTIVSTPAIKSSKRLNWNREELGDWLIKTLQHKSRCIVGIDHGFSFPITYFERNRIESWPEFLDDFVKYWPTQRAGSRVEQFRNQSERQGDAKELRLTELWTSSAKSVFQFDVQGSVAKSTHAGLPFLKQLRDEVPGIHFWPFDGWSPPPGKSVVAETYPSLFRNRYPRQSRTVDQQDAYSISCWLRDMSNRGRLADFISPPLSKPEMSVAQLEGWILGVY